MRDKVYRLLAGLFSFPKMKREFGSRMAAFIILNRAGGSVALANKTTRSICPFWVRRRRKAAAAWERIAHTSPELALERRGL